MNHVYHIYGGERCMYCNVNIYDAAIYDDDEECPARTDEPLTWTTESENYHEGEGTAIHWVQPKAVRES